MNQDLLHHVASQSLRTKIPQIESGMSVKISQKIREGEKERVQNFEGLVIAVNGGRGVSATITIRKIVGGIGVEKIFPLHGKNIVKIEILKKAKVRRSKLYYMRELRGKAARMSETHIHEVVHDEEADKKEAEAKAKKEAEAAKAEDSGEAKKDDKSAETEEKVENVESSDSSDTVATEDASQDSQEPEGKKSAGAGAENTPKSEASSPKADEGEAQKEAEEKK